MSRHALGSFALPRCASASLSQASAALQAAKQATIGRMGFAAFAIHILTWMFFVGLAGSTVVVLISFIEDGRELFGKDE
jgi:hypothetical protein